MAALVQSGGGGAEHQDRGNLYGCGLLPPQEREMEQMGRAEPLPPLQGYALDADTSSAAGGEESTQAVPMGSDLVPVILHDWGKQEIRGNI